MILYNKKVAPCLLGGTTSNTYNPSTARERSDARRRRCAPQVVSRRRSLQIAAFAQHRGANNAFACNHKTSTRRTRPGAVLRTQKAAGARTERLKRDLRAQYIQIRRDSLA